MPRFFNTAGPVHTGKHYSLSPLERIHLHEILALIAEEKYFVLHAPRQTGKTSCLLALQAYLNAQGQYRCLYCNLEVGQAARENVTAAMQALLAEISRRAAISLNDQYPASVWPELLKREGPYSALGSLLMQWAAQSPRPLIVLMDEVDSLVGDTLIALLRQLRAGYDQRPAHFPQSIILCGVRDVRDYRLRTDDGKSVITGGSAFNIKAASLRLGNFTSTDVAALYGQHTQDTGQVFADEAVSLAFDLTRGQPWLVNALAYEICFEMPAGRHRSQPVTAEMVQEAKERLILRRETHLDQLSDKLKEPRVYRVINPMLQGRDLDQTVQPDDLQYVFDLGLIARTPMGVQIANPIYREIIPRELTWITQLNFENTIRPIWYLADDGRLDMDKLLTAFQQFFREHSAHWVERFDYKEAGPQLLLQAFLQRILNSGGRIDREYGLGRQRTDLLVVWPYNDQVQRVVLELKIQHTSLESTVQQGLEQTCQCMDACGAADGHLIIFNRDPAISWNDKIFRREAEYQGHPIVVWGM